MLVRNPHPDSNALRRPVLFMFMLFIRGAFPQSTAEPFTNPMGMEFIKIPAGSFMMGTPDPACPADDPATKVNEYENCMDAVQIDERPFHKVAIGRDFHIGKFEVTQSEWEKVMGANPSGFPKERLGKDASRNPVENVSWNDIRKFIRKLNRMDRASVYRLPTEAEWEYACRAGTTGDFYGKPRDALMWFDRNSGHKTHAAGEAKPNAWGLYDMLGNVWEWCQDWYGKSYYANSPEADPQGLEKGERRVIRGGGIYDWSDQCRIPFRCSGKPDDRCDTVGFRLVRMAK
jgi:formylglycine-generating enzyme required for sulfatase activity